MPIIARCFDSMLTSLKAPLPYLEVSFSVNLTDRWPKVADHNAAASSCLLYLLVCNTVRFSGRYLHNTRPYAKYI
jgi:hypothetical protein